MIIAFENMAHKSRLNGDFWKWRALRRAFTIHANSVGAYDTNVTENERELLLLLLLIIIIILLLAVFTLGMIMAPRLAVDTIFTSQITRIATPALTQTSVTRIKHHRANRLTFFWPERITLYQAKLKHFTL